MSRRGVRTLAVALLAAGLSTGTARARQTPPAGVRTLPATGLDFSGVDQFWRIVDMLTKDREPTKAEWAALLATPGYRLAQVNLGPTLKDDIDIAFKPSRHAEFERLSAGDGEHALQLRHLALAGRQRADLVAYRDSLAHSTAIADAVALAAQSLPTGATSQGAPPLVAVAIFRDDGYSLPQGIVIDLLNVRHVSLVVTLAHEFHHSYVNRLARPLPAGHDSASDDALRESLHNLRNEGLADLIDKPHPFVSPNPGLAGYAAQYNREYDRTPAAVLRLDSLLTSVAGSPEQLAGRSMEVQMLFWSSGHPNGAYIAREIQQTFGVDSLRAAALDPARFLRIFAAAERAHGRPAPLSPKAWTVIDALDVKYWK